MPKAVSKPSPPARVRLAAVAAPSTPKASPPATSTSYFYGYDPEYDKLKAWGAPADNPDAREYADLREPMQARPTDCCTAVWGDPTKDAQPVIRIDDITVEELRAIKKMDEENAGSARLWSMKDDAGRTLCIMKTKKKGEVHLILFRDGAEKKKGREDAARVRLGEGF